MLLLLVKMFKNKDHALGFLNGDIYVNRIDHYIKHGDDNIEDTYWRTYDNLGVPNTRGGVTSFVQIPVALMRKDESHRVAHRVEEVRHFHAFCMYAIYPGSLPLPKIGQQSVRVISERCERVFGAHAIIIRAFEEFRRRFDLVGDKDMQGYRRDFVSYYDPATFDLFCTDNMIVPFFKDRIFKYQQEFRFVFDTGTKGGDALEFAIESLRGIADYCPTSKIAVERDDHAGHLYYGQGLPENI